MKPKTLDKIIENVVERYIKVVDQDAVVFPKILHKIINQCLEELDFDQTDSDTIEAPLLSALVENLKENITTIYGMISEDNKTPDTLHIHQTVLNSLDDLNGMISRPKAA